VSCRCTQLHEVIVEVVHCELTPAISMQDVKPLATLSFCRRLDILDGYRCTIFCGEQDYPHVYAKIIHQ
jgi:hypothetical protein